MAGKVNAMPTLQLDKNQVIELAGQLSSEEREELFQSLLSQQWRTWVELSRAAIPGARRAAAERGLNWEAMSETQREAFVDNVVHEDD
jgi:hypothetical protein